MSESLSSPLEKLLQVLLEAIAAFPLGCPSGPLYMMLQSKLGSEWTLDTHLTALALLERRGYLTQRAHVLHVTAQGSASLATPNAVPPTTRGGQ